MPYALELLRALDAGQGAKLHLTYVLDPKQAYRLGVSETKVLHEARTYLKSITARLTADPAWQAIAVTARVEPDVNVVSGIERIAEQGADLRGDTVDFVAMASHGREGLARWLAGSVTEGLAHDVHVPVLIVHPEHEQTTVGSQRDDEKVTEQVPRMPLF